MKTLKNAKDSTLNFVSRNRNEIVGCAYLVICFAAGYYGTKKVLEIQNDLINKEVANRTLFNAAAAGHQFKYDAASDTLWDLNVRPEMAN